MPSTPSRRRLLRTLVAVGGVGLAGCSGNEGSDGTPTNQGRPSTDATASTTPGMSSSTAPPTTTSKATTTARRSYSPPPYVDESAFEEQSVTVEGPECPLPGRLSLPAGDGTVPGVVIVHGSGAQDRDGTIGPNKPYRDLGWGLATQGIATLRYDKRTYACPETLDRYGYTIDDIVTEDAVAALETLAAESRVRPVFVVGHSLGGAMAPRIATQYGEAAGVGLLAANARPFYRILPAQLRYLAELDGRVTDEERRRIEAAKQLVERIDGERLESGRTYGVGRLQAAASYWRSLREYDRTGTADALSVPYFVAQGERDYHVSVEDDFRAWKRALSDHDGSRFELYPDLNHMFFPGEKMGRPAEYREPHNVAERVVADLATWIDARTGDEGRLPPTSEKA